MYGMPADSTAPRMRRKTSAAVTGWAAAAALVVSLLIRFAAPGLGPWRAGGPDEGPCAPGGQGREPGG